MKLNRPQVQAIVDIHYLNKFKGRARKEDLRVSEVHFLELLEKNLIKYGYAEPRLNKDGYYLNDSVLVLTEKGQDVFDHVVNKVQI